jgi:putative transposase
MRRKQYDGSFKARIVLEALGGGKTVAELASRFGVHPTVINRWKRRAVASLPAVLSDRRDRTCQDQKAAREELCRKIGQLTMELDWLREKMTFFPSDRRRELIEWKPTRIPLVRQCKLMGLARSGFYYRRRQEHEENLQVMLLIERLYMTRPFLGSRRMSECLRNLGHKVNRKRVQRLMRLMGLAAVCPNADSNRAGKGVRFDELKRESHATSS